MMRPEVSEVNLNKVKELSKYPKHVGFDFALTVLLQDFEKLQGRKSQWLHSPQLKTNWTVSRHTSQGE